MTQQNQNIKVTTTNGKTTTITTTVKLSNIKKTLTYCYHLLSKLNHENIENQEYLKSYRWSKATIGICHQWKGLETATYSGIMGIIHGLSECLQDKQDYFEEGRQDALKRLDIQKPLSESYCEGYVLGRRQALMQREYFTQLYKLK